MSCIQSIRLHNGFIYIYIYILILYQKYICIKCLAPRQKRTHSFLRFQAEEELEAEVQDIADEDLKLKLQVLQARVGDY